MKKVILTTGGTGGHIYPALSIGKELKKKGVDVLFIGTEHRMEKVLVPKENFRFIGLDIIPLRKPISFLKMILGIKESIKILWKEKPDAVIGFGNYISIPTLVGAKLLRIPYYLQEQNSTMGLANKYFYKGAKKVFLAFENTLDFIDDKYKSRFLVSGNPIRDEFYNRDRESDRNYIGLSQNEKMILVMGGSLGAENINEGIISNWKRIIEDKNIKLYWATGKENYEKILKRISKENNIVVKDYFHNTAQLMNASDLVICRAGASTISELIQLEKPSILIPYDFVGQRENADILEYVNSAKIYSNNEVKCALDEALDLINKGDILEFMGENIRGLKKEKATDIIVNEILI